MEMDVVITLVKAIFKTVTLITLIFGIIVYWACAGVGGQNFGAGVWENNLSLDGLGGIPGFDFAGYGNGLGLGSLDGLGSTLVI